MVDQGTHEYWGEKHQPFVPAWTNPDELRELADAIVRNGAKIEHKVVPDLRQLIEAVQQHADARLAEIGPDGKPTIDDPTKIVIYGGETARCNCSELTIAVRLSASIRFTSGANFREATFIGGARFREATFTGEADFREITLERRIRLHEAQFEPDVRLSFRNAYLRPGCEITLPSERLRYESLRPRSVDSSTPSSPSSERDWFDETEAVLGADQDTLRIWMWFVQYCIAVCAPWTEHIWPWLRKTLSIHAHGTFILHEDSHDPNKLRSAAAQYNQLRDNFRHQPSTDELEDLCHFRYMDLRRKAGDLWMQRQPKSSDAARYEPPNPIRWLQWLLFDGILYWLIWRNCLGYLVRPMRPLVTAFLVIMIGWLVYGFGANENTIHYSGALAEGVTGIQMWDKSWWTPLYFSVTTFTTLGYGDFAPTGWLRLVAGAQAILGVGLIALFTVSWGRKMIR